MKLLILDRDAALREMLVDLLAEEPISTKTGGSSAEARALLAEEEVDAVLCDEALLWEDGPPVQGIAEGNPLTGGRASALPLIVMTSGATPALMHASIVARLRKPFTRARLIEALEVATRAISAGLPKPTMRVERSGVGACVASAQGRPPRSRRDGS